MTSLGSYILISLVFVFFTMVEFALVLILKEWNERTRYETTDESKSEKLFSRRLTELQKNIANVSPPGEMMPDLKTKEDSGREQITIEINRPGFFANLPLNRKVDVFAFVIYHLFYSSFNLYYWTNLDAEQ